MKNIKWLSRVFIMVLGLSVFSACSEDDDKANPVFPEKQAVDCSVGQEKTLTFNAEHSWTLASNRLWCQFKDGNDLLPSISGGVGQQTITITVTEAVWGFEDAIAEITMGMEGQTQVIAAVNRAAKGYKIEAYLMEGDNKVVYDDNNPVVLPYFPTSEIAKFANVSVDANFDWKVVNCPAWIMVEEDKLFGEAGKTMSWELQFQTTDAITKVEEQNGFIEFMDINGGSRLKVPVKYNGMPEDKVEFTRPARDYWNWNISADATQYWKAALNPGGETTKFDFPFNFTAMSRGENTVVCIDVNEYGYNPRETYYPGMYWFNATKQEGYGVDITVDPNTGADRKGCVMVIPNTVLKGLPGGVFDLAYEDGSAIKSEFEQYVAFEFTQLGEQASSRGFVVLDDAGHSMAGDLADMTSQVDSESLKKMYGTDNVHMLTLNAAKSYETITATPNGYPNMVCQYSLLTPWSGVSVEANYANGIYVMGISAGEKPEMRITFTNAGDVFAVLLLSQY